MASNSQSRQLPAPINVMDRSLPRSDKARNKKNTESKKEKQQEMEKKEREKKFKVREDEAIHRDQLST